MNEDHHHHHQLCPLVSVVPHLELRSIYSGSSWSPCFAFLYLGLDKQMMREENERDLTRKHLSKLRRYEHLTATRSCSTMGRCKGMNNDKKKKNVSPGWRRRETQSFIIYIFDSSWTIQREHRALNIEKEKRRVVRDITLRLNVWPHGHPSGGAKQIPSCSSASAAPAA